ncbi:nucleotide-binding universal stress UspA family protein [Prauserella shujinwangii]|uniref:Nucleotide-binding universal stress UspA family protein n=1 Tax=Prauserella shujinwangii TaxID=1453103 RepID=A0A2T0LL74_9PSEU|nr:universal stress protein [Prauserella shujinwangii]PRX43693.1 nucleotide-binding universal stress UspA family protein [Prauserella shujinwangii]
MSASVQDLEQYAVVAGFDGSDNARRAVHWAAAEALARDRSLLVVQSFEWGIPLIARGATSASEYGVDRIREFAESALRDLVTEVRDAHPGLTVTSQMPDGAPEETVPLLAEGAAAELVAVGGSGRGAVARAALGSTVGELARTLRCPLVVVRDGEGEDVPRSGPVVVGVDGSAASDRAIEFALDFAARHGAPVRAVHAWSDWPLDITVSAPLGQVGQDEATDAAEKLAREHVETRRDRFPDVPVEWHSVADRPGSALLELAGDARLLVVGSHGRGAVRRVLLGSVSNAVVHHAPCPVAVLRELADTDEEKENDEGGAQ